MGTLQDVSLKLMRPVKELVTWDFPLAQVLEEYFALLEEPCQVNFGEAALVVQNSVVAYSKRVDELSNEAITLNQSFIHNVDKVLDQSKKVEKKVKTKRAQLKNFELLDLSKEIGKNIDLKIKPDKHKPVQLLSKRFTQLESIDIKGEKPIEVLDVNGEVIGKKYDFRCNQYLSIDGILVNNLTPADFKDYDLVVTSTPGCPTEINPDRPRSSGYCSNNSYHGTSSNCSVSGDHNNFEIEDIVPENVGNTSLNQHDESGVVASPQTRLDENSKSLQNGASEVDSVISNTPVLTEADPMSYLSSTTGIESGYMSGLDSTKSRITRCDEQRKAADRRNKNPWEPIPFTEGTKDIPTSKKKMFRLPTPIQSSECSPAKKRKYLCSDRKGVALFRFLLNESDIYEKELVNKSPKRTAFSTLKTDDLEDFQKSFYDILNAPGKPDFHYFATNTITKHTQQEPTPTESQDTTDANDVAMADHTESPCRSPTPFEDSMRHESQDSPAFDDQTELQASTPDCPLVSNDYQRLISKKVQQIFKDNEEKTEIEKAVAKWHDMLQPKLVEAESRSSFMIKEYANKIIDALRKADDKQLEFDKVVEGQTAPEVARYFLATLQLANMYNVDLKSGADMRDGVKLQLLDNGSNTFQDF